MKDEIKNKIISQLTKRVEKALKKGDIIQAQTFKERIKNIADRKNSINYSGQFVLKDNQVVFNTNDNLTISFDKNSQEYLKKVYF